MLNIRNSDICNKCTEVEFHMHFVYFCKFVKPTWEWFQNFVEKVCNIKINYPIKVLMLDMECKGKKQKNTLNVLIIEYINFMWYRRDDIISTAERIS